MSNDTPWIPVTFENCDRVAGPFYHGTASVLVRAGAVRRLGLLGRMVRLDGHQMQRQSLDLVTGHQM